MNNPFNFHVWVMNIHCKDVFVISLKQSVKQQYFEQT